MWTVVVKAILRFSKSIRGGHCGDDGGGAGHCDE